MTFRQKLNALMVDRTNRGISRRVGVHETTFASYRRGAVPGSDIAVRLAKVLGVDAGWLMDDAREWPPVPGPAVYPDAPALPAPVTSHAA